MLEFESCKTFHREFVYIAVELGSLISEGG